MSGAISVFSAGQWNSFLLIEANCIYFTDIRINFLDKQSSASTGSRQIKASHAAVFVSATGNEPDLHEARKKLMKMCEGRRKRLVADLPYKGFLLAIQISGPSQNASQKDLARQATIFIIMGTLDGT